MTERIWMAAMVGLLLSAAVHTAATAAGRPTQDPRTEVCEAFPWDVPVEQSFTPAAVLRWRRGVERARQIARSASDGEANMGSHWDVSPAR